MPLAFIEPQELICITWNLVQHQVSHQQTNQSQCKPQQKGFCITTPKLHTPNPMEAPILPTALTLLLHICQTLPKYAPELWATLQPATGSDPQHLAEYLTLSTKPIIIVSNASLNSQKCGAFSWIITTTNQELWMGNGTVPGPMIDAYSGRAEGFGVLATFTFLECYIHLTVINETTS